MSYDIITIMDDTVGRLQSWFPVHQFDVIVGSLLGDGRLECRSKGIRLPKTARFRAHHGSRQKDYVQWKYNVLENFVIAPPRAITRFDNKRNIHETSWYFHTKSTKEFGILHSWFYTDKGVKQLPKHLDKIITPRMLSVWYMDDGNYTGTSCTLNTHSLCVSEQHHVVEILRRWFGVSSTLVKDRHQYKISIKRASLYKFMDVVAPHCIESMSYKIAYPRNDSFRLRNGVTAREASRL